MLEIAAKYVDSPEVLLAVMENDRLLIDLVETETMFGSVGFVDNRVYRIHRVSFVDPDWFIGSKSGTWSLWKTGLPQNLVDKVHNDLLVETRRTTLDDGYKLTSYLIHATGKKPTHNP